MTPCIYTPTWHTMRASCVKATLFRRHLRYRHTKSTCVFLHVSSCADNGNGCRILRNCLAALAVQVPKNLQLLIEQQEQDIRREEKQQIAAQTRTNHSHDVDRCIKVPSFRNSRFRQMIKASKLLFDVRGCPRFALGCNLPPFTLTSVNEL